MTISSILKKQFLGFILFYTSLFMFAQQNQLLSNNVFKYSLHHQKMEIIDSSDVSRSLEQIEELKKSIRLSDEKSQSISKSTDYRMPIYRIDGDFKIALKKIDTTKDYRLQVIHPKGLRY